MKIIVHHQFLCGVMEADRQNHIHLEGIPPHVVDIRKSELSMNTRDHHNPFDQARIGRRSTTKSMKE